MVKQRRRPVPTLTSEELGTADAYRHDDVTRHGKYTTARKAAKRFIALFGEKAYEQKLTEYSCDLADIVTALVLAEFGNLTFPDTEIYEGFNAAQTALIATYTGPMKPEESMAPKSALQHPPVRNVVLGHLRRGQAGRMRALANQHNEADIVETPKMDAATVVKMIAAAPMTVIIKPDSQPLTPARKELLHSSIVLGDN